MIAKLIAYTICILSLPIIAVWTLVDILKERHNRAFNRTKQVKRNVRVKA